MDKIKNPDHYQGKFGLDGREVQRNFIPYYEKYGGQVCYDMGNVIKYILRAPNKNGVEDLLKAKQYLEWVIEAVTPIESPETIEFSEEMQRELILQPKSD